MGLTNADSASAQPVSPVKDPKTAQLTPLVELAVLFAACQYRGPRQKL